MGIFTVSVHPFDPPENIDMNRGKSKVWSVSTSVVSFTLRVVLIHPTTNILIRLTQYCQNYFS